MSAVNTLTALLITTLLLLPTMQVTAEPVVLIDEGGISTDKYRRILQPATEVPDFGGQWIQANSPLIQDDPNNVGLWLPLSTDKLSPKRIAEGVDVDFAELDAPICIIGSDPLSLRWIEIHLHDLVRLKARCWLVQANDFEDFKAVSRTLQGRVLMTPADGNAIADFFGIHHYPLFIDQRFMGQ